MVHIRLAVRIDTRQKRRHLGQVGEILPGEGDAGGGGHCRKVERMVGRAARGMQADDGIDEAALVQHPADRARVLAAPRDGDGTLGGGNGQGVAQIVMRVDEGGAGKMQPHHLHQHLVGIGGAVECAGAGAVIGRHLGLEQVGAGRLAAGERLADSGLFGIRQAACHRSRGHENHRKMPE